MALIIHECQKISASTTPVTVNTACRSFIISNASQSATIYIKEAKDGVACTPTNGFAITAGKLSPVTLSAEKLSIVATAAADVFIMYGAEV